jgi:hypothetical protein
MLIAINCGDDTDCTAATVGATMGILDGTKSVPKDWQEYIGDGIITVSINKGSIGRSVPKTCTELTERVVAQAACALHLTKASSEIVCGEDMIPENVYDIFMKECRESIPKLSFAPYSMHFDYTYASVDVILDGAPDIAPLEEKKVTVKLHNNYDIYDVEPRCMDFRWWLPEGFTVEGRKTNILPQRSSMYEPNCESVFVIKAPEKVEKTNKCVLEVSCEGRITPMYIPVIFVG